MDSIRKRYGSHSLYRAISMKTSENNLGQKEKSKLQMTDDKLPITKNG